MSIIQTTGVITNMVDLSPTAREYTITPATPFTFNAGAFVNLFVEDSGEVIRRAYSITSSDTDQHTFTIAIRHTLGGRLTPLFWKEDFLGRTIGLMGPLGLNTVDKMHQSSTYLFGFGVGAGVVKSIADAIARRENQTQLTIVTGNRTIEEILYKEYFDHLANGHNNISVTYVVSDKNQTIYPVGYIQDHIAGFDFNNADVYMCGQGVACQALKATVKATNPSDCQLFIEDFH